MSQRFIPLTITITARVIRQTKFALGIWHPVTGAQVWLPISHITFHTEPAPGTADITIPGWLANEKGLLQADRQPGLDLFEQTPEPGQ